MQPATPAQPLLSAVTQPTCTTATGSFTITNYDGSYTYAVTPSAGVTRSGATITAPAGTYTVTATLGACTSISSASITVNAQPVTPAQPLISTVTQPTCSTATGSFTITNYDGSYTYAVTPSGGVTRSGATITAPAGTYTVTATLGACTSISSASITVNAQPITPGAPTVGTITQPTCTTATGSVVLNGLPTGAWTINSGALTGSGATTTITGLIPGTYNFTVTNAAGCTSVASAAVTINMQPATPAQPLLSAVTQPTCTTATGSFTITNYDGSYTYAVTPSAGVTRSGAIITAPAGTYTVTATLGACTSISSASITVNAQPVTPAQPLISTVTQPTCSTATGSFTITNYDGSYTYAVTPSAGVTRSGATITAPAGNYTVTATLGACTSISSASITVNAQPITPAQPLLSAATQPTCTTATGSFTITNYHGTYTYTITPSAGVTRSGATITAPAGTYAVTATLGACTSISSASVTVNAQPATPAQPLLSAVTQPTCTTATGSFTITNYDGSYTYAVTPSGGVTRSGATITAPAGTYTVTATLGACTSISSASIIVNAQPATPAKPFLSVVTQPTCTLSTGSFTITNYNGSYTYTVTPSGGVTRSGATITAPAGNYTVTATLGACTSISSASITVNAQPITPAQPLLSAVTHPTCTVTTGSFTITNYDGSYTYAVTPSGGVTRSGATITAPAGTYTVTATLGACTSTTSAPVTVNAPPVIPNAPIVGTITQPTCATATGSVVLNGLPTGAWTINPGGVAGSGATTTITGLNPGTYNFTVTNAAGCTSFGSTAVTINTQPATPAQPLLSAVTQPTCTTATGSFTITNYNGSNNYTVSPSAGVMRSGATITAPAGTYTVTAKSGSCNSIASAPVTVNTQPVTPSAPLIGMITQPTCAVPTGSVVLNGLPTTGTWIINPGNISGSGSSKTISGLAVGSYNFTVKNAAGCTSPVSANVVMASPSGPNAGIVVNDVKVFCNGLILTATTTSTVTPLTYEWFAPGGNTPFATTSSIELGNNDPDGIYSVYITSNTCRSANPGTYNYQKQNWLGNYSIIAINKLKFGTYQNVMSGSVGLLSTVNKATFDKYDSIPFPYSSTPGAFVKARNMEFELPSYIPNKYYGVPNVVLPPVLVNNTIPTGSSITIKTNNWVQPANVRYKDITIYAGITATLTDSIYGDITLKQGATVIFTKPVVNLSTLSVYQGSAPAGAPYTNYSKVKFASATCIVKVSKKVDMDDYNILNPDGKSVTFYLADNNSDEEDFTIKYGSHSVFNCNIYIPIGELRIYKGSNTPRCYMNGMFIADEIRSDHYVTWNGNSCNSANPLLFAAPPVENQRETEKTGDIFTVKLYPNPTLNDFNIQVITNSIEPVMIRILDVNGRIMKDLTRLSKAQVTTMTNDLKKGIYFVEVTQGQNKNTVKLVKL